MCSMLVGRSSWMCPHGGERKGRVMSSMLVGRSSWMCQHGGERKGRVLSSMLVEVILDVSTWRREEGKSPVFHAGG